MKQKTGRKLLSFLLSLALVLGMMPGMSLTAYAVDNPYASLKKTTTVITFDSKSWYLINYDNETVTLLSKECVGVSKYSDTDSYVEYAFSAVKTAVDNWYSINITEGAKTAVNGGGMFLLSTEEANSLSADVRKCSQASDAFDNCWWLCSSGNLDYGAACVDGDDGYVNSDGINVLAPLGVRPALKLNLESVIFKSNEFTLKPDHTHSFTYSADGATITATCSAEGCDLPPSSEGGNDHVAKLTLSAADAAYTGSVYTGANISDTTEWTSAGLTTPTIEYVECGDTSYTKSTTAPTDAGTYAASITVDTDKTATADFTISPMSLTIDAATATNRTYDKNSTAVTISTVTFKDSSEKTVALTLGEDSDYTVTGEMNDANAGTGKTVNVTVTLKNANYSLATKTTTTTVNIEKAGEQTISDVTDTLLYTSTSVSESVASKMPDDAGTLSYSAGTASKTGSVTVSGFDVNATSGAVTAILSGGAAGDTVTLPVTISSTNYADSTVNVVITLTAKGNAGVTISGVPTQTKTYGDADFTLTGSATDEGTGSGAWTWSTSDETVFQITPNGATATVKILKAGSATVTATYESDTTVGTETTDTITVNTKTITIAAKDQNIYVGGTVPTLDGADFYTVTGLVGEDTLTTAPTLAYQKDGNAATPDNIKAGTYDIVASGANAGDNYNISYTKGALTISEKPAATVKEAPTANPLTYNGQAQKLVTVGEAEGGEMQYALGTDDKTAPTTGYTTSIPTKTDAGTYYVWYKVVGDTNHNNSEAACVPATIKCTVKFVDEDGTTVLKEATGYEKGTKASEIVKPDDPTKASTAEYTYTFDKWVLSTDADKTIEDVTANETTYKAAYKATKNKYWITFQDEDGTELEKKEVEYGIKPEYTGKTPTKEATAENTYTFAGWTPEISKVTGDITYKATYKAAEITKDEGKKEVSTEAPVKEPTKEEKAVISINAGLKISQTGSKINIKWGEVSEADSYDVYVTYCGKKFGKPVKTVKKNSTTSVNVTKLNGKKIDLKKNFKVYVAAYKITDGKKEVLAKTITGHVVGRKNTEYSNAKKITLSKSKYTIKIGKTAKVKAKTVLVDQGKKQLSDAHAAQFRYASSNKSIATVDKNGKIKGIAKGTCTIYVYARNGYAKTVKVTVK